MSLDDIPKRVQYVIIDSNFVNGTNNTFSFDLQLESNTHVEDMSRVIGIQLVDFYITQVGEADPDSLNGTTDIAKYVDIVCPEIPKAAQILNERHGQLFARCPLERHFTPNSATVLRDKQVKIFNRKQNYFNPISIKKLNFTVYEQQDDNDYVLLQPDAKWYMVLEITTVNVKEKPKDRELQILQALQQLIGKIDLLNQNVQRLPDKPPEPPKEKYSFGTLVLILATIFGSFVWFVNRGASSGPSSM
jgi:hypothetical protein